MAVSMNSPPAMRPGSSEYRWIYVLTLPAFVLVALVGRLRRRGDAAGRGTLLGEARETAHTIIPFTFMH